MLRKCLGKFERESERERDCLFMHMKTVPGKCTIYLQTIEFSRHLITKHLQPTYSCIDISVSGQRSPLSCLQLFLKTHGHHLDLTQIL